MAAEHTSPERSIYTTLLIPMILLVLAELLLFSGILAASGALERLNQNDRDIMGQQIISRKDSLENYFVGTVGNLESLAGSINDAVLKRVEENQLSLDSFETINPETNALLEEITPGIIETLRAKRVSGAFVIFNTQDLSSGYSQHAFGKLPGLYIRDMDPAATPSPRNEDLVIERASTDIVQSFGITTANDWRPMFDFDTADATEMYDFFYYPWQTAYNTEGEKDATDYAFWSTAPLLGVGTVPYVITYTIPLILPNGTVYGVVGVDLTADYVKSLMPSQELLRDEGASYVLAMFSENAETKTASSIDMLPVVTNGKEAVSGMSYGSPVPLTRMDSGEYQYQSPGGPYFVGCEFFRLYNTNTPFEHNHWALAGMVPESTLHRFANQVRLMIALASILMLALGIVGSIVAARSVSKPIRGLSSDVAHAQLKNAEMPELARTGITEVDQLTGAIMSLSKDIASVKQLEQERIEHERDYDLLTGLMNRRALYREAGKIFASPAVLKHAALVMIDLDNLKMFNDTYGHDCGDKYIYQAARSFEDAVPVGVLVARVSGDEFFILYYGYDSREEIEKHITSLGEAIPKRQLALPNGQQANLSASGGVAFYPEDGHELTELMHLADFAMYQAKIAGKNHICYFNLDSYQQQSTVKRAIEELNELIADSANIDYHFQPIFDAKTGEVFAYEALMRASMQNLRNPQDVVILARQEGRLNEIEKITWERSFECYNALCNRQEVSDNAFLFLNSFANVAMEASDLAALSQRYPHIMAHTVVEITEAENMDDAATDTKRSIPGFSGLFALDDYGSGYNSEIMLLDLKPTFVKVDITIVRDIDKSIDKQRIMSNVVEYAHERDMIIVAEGVETESELIRCIKLGVDMVQGFYLARPARVPNAISPDALALIHEMQTTQ